LDELNRKAKLYDEFLEKTCEWLNNINTDNYMDSDVFQMYNLVLDFKQAMEE
jgi:hypothetical protein